jgi:hypothetical protein
MYRISDICLISGRFVQVSRFAQATPKDHDSWSLTLRKPSWSVCTSSLTDSPDFLHQPSPYYLYFSRFLTVVPPFIGFPELVTLDGRSPLGMQVQIQRPP